MKIWDVEGVKVKVYDWCLVLFVFSLELEYSRVFGFIVIGILYFGVYFVRYLVFLVVCLWLEKR